jgi:anti-anti-sigma factor
MIYDQNKTSDSVSRIKWNNWFVITISGKFSVKYLLKIKSIFEEAENSNEHLVAIDLRPATYIDSSAITIMLNFHRRCIEFGGNLILFGLNPDIESILSIVGIDKIIPIVKNINDLPD